MTRFLIFLLLIFGSFSRFSWGAEESSIRASIERAVPYLETRGQWWIEEKKCVSCHRVQTMIWSLEAAADRGIKIDRELLDQTKSWAQGSMLKLNDKQIVVGSLNLEAVSQLVWANSNYVSTENQTEAREKYLQLILDKQQDDALWKANGQIPFQRRPKAEGILVSSMWNALALGTANQPDSQAARKRAMEVILQSPPGKSTEAVAVRLLLAVQTDSATELEAGIAELRKRQQPDGSWKWIEGTPESDPLGTGLALYAMRTAGVPPDDPALSKAARYLIERQSEEGAWKTPGTKTKAKGKPVETSNYWGTCWAVIGLTSLLDSTETQ